LENAVNSAPEMMDLEVLGSLARLKAAGPWHTAETGYVIVSFKLQPFKSQVHDEKASGSPRLD